MLKKGSAYSTLRCLSFPCHWPGDVCLVPPARNCNPSRQTDGSRAEACNKTIHRWLETNSLYSCAIVRDGWLDKGVYRGQHLYTMCNCSFKIPSLLSQLPLFLVVHITHYATEQRMHQSKPLVRESNAFRCIDTELKITAHADTARNYRSSVD